MRVLLIVASLCLLFWQITPSLAQQAPEDSKYGRPADTAHEVKQHVDDFIVRVANRARKSKGPKPTSKARPEARGGNSAAEASIFNSNLAPDKLVDDPDVAALNEEAGHLKTEIVELQKKIDDQPWWSPQNAMTISSVILAFGAIVIALASFTTKGESSLEEKLRLYGTVMVITMAGFLVVAGYNDTQIAAPLGLLGTIAGYLLGKDTTPKYPGPSPRPIAAPDATAG